MWYLLWSHKPASDRNFSPRLPLGKGNMLRVEEPLREHEQVLLPITTRILGCITCIRNGYFKFNSNQLIIEKDGSLTSMLSSRRLISSGLLMSIPLCKIGKSML